MAKAARSFSDKMKKNQEEAAMRHVKIIKGETDSESGVTRFPEKITAVPAEGDIAAHIDKMAKAGK